MKRIVILLLILIPCCLVSAYIGFRFGGVVGRHRVTTTRAVYVTSSLDVLRKIRSGDLPSATSELEYSCFVDSVDVLSDTGWHPPSLHKVFIPFLREYRQSYRTNQAEWTPVERQLEDLLANKQ
jgi:hypothetical protein